MEVIYQDDIEKKETQNIKYLYTSENNFNIDNKVVFCYSSIIKNFDNSYPDKNAIMAFFTEKNNTSKYNYKYLLFFPDSQRFSNVLFLKVIRLIIFLKYFQNIVLLLEKQIYIVQLMKKQINL